MNFCTTLNLVNNVLFSPPVGISFLFKEPGAELKDQGASGGQKFVVENSLHLMHHCSHQNSLLFKQLFTVILCIMYCLSWPCRSVQDSVCAWVGWSILGDDLNSRDWVKKSNNPYILWHDAVWVLLFTCVKWKLWWHQTKHCKYQSTLLRGMEL